MRGRNAVLSKEPRRGGGRPPKNNVFVFAAVTQGRAQMLQAPAPARARVLAHLAAAPQSSAAFKTFHAHVMSCSCKTRAGILP